LLQKGLRKQGLKHFFQSLHVLFIPLKVAKRSTKTRIETRIERFFLSLLTFAVAKKSKKTRIETSVLLQVPSVGYCRVAKRSKKTRIETRFVLFSSDIPQSSCRRVQENKD